MLAEISIKITDLTPPTSTPSLWSTVGQSEARGPSWGRCEGIPRTTMGGGGEGRGGGSLRLLFQLEVIKYFKIHYRELL